MNKEYYEYVINNRISGFQHPLRETIIALFFDLQKNSDQITDLVNYYFSKLDGEMGVLSDNKIRDFHYLLINCCFYFCEFLIDNGVDSELVNNSTDYFVNLIQYVETEKEMKKLLNDIGEASLELYRKRNDKNYSLLITRSINYINQQLYSNITLNKVAAYLGVTPQYLTTKFKIETDKTLYQYIEEKKIEQAKIMLAHTYKTVTLISSALGFNSTAHFSSSFKRLTTYTPSKYRQHHDNGKSRFGL